MTNLLLGVGFLLTMAVAAFSIPPLRRLAIERGWVDRPDGERKLHRLPIPTVGGIAMAAGFAIGFAFLLAVQERLSFALEVPPFGLWMGALLMLGVGLYDDIHGLGFKNKLLAEFVAAFLILYAGYRIDLSSLPFADPYQEALFSIPLSIFWIVGIINAVNLIDGLDGLAGGVVMIGILSLALIFGLQGEIQHVVLALLIVGAIAGFLIHNFNPASVFMGDAGSLFLGFMLAAYSLQGHAHPDPLLAIVVPIAVLGLPILDTNLAIVRRLVQRKAVCAPDKDHIHHRLLHMWSPTRAVLTLYAAAACFGGLAILMVLFPLHLAPILLGIALLLSFAGIYALGYVRWRPLLYNLRPRNALFQRFQHHLTSPVAAHTDGSPKRPLERVDMQQARGELAWTSSTGDGASAEAVSVLSVSNQPTWMITTDSIVAASDHLTSAELGQEAVVLDVQSGTYFGVNEVGARILQILEHPKPVSSIIKILQEEYDVEEKRLEQDVLEFLREMEEKHLVRTSYDTAA